jgi:hypothetical protein
MADEAFSLKDAIALYSGKIDLSHKLWAYLQVVAVILNHPYSESLGLIVLRRFSTGIARGATQ